MVKSLGTSGHNGLDRFRLRFLTSCHQLTVAQMVLAAASMSTDFDYAPTNQQTVAVFIGFITFHGLLNTLSTRWLARITGVCHSRVFLRVVLRLLQHRLYLCPHHRIVRHSERQKRYTDCFPRSGQQHRLVQ
jgi:hypothetical protein